MKNCAKIISILLLAALCAGLLAGCSDTAPAESNNNGSAAAPVTAAPVDMSKAAKITLEGGSASVSGGGVSVNGSTISISAAGEYAVSGTLDNGQIIVNTGDDAMKVTLILNNANITCLDKPAIYVEKADKLKLVLADGSENTVTSGVEGLATDPNASGAAIFSEDDLDLEGSGKLTVNGYINNGIASKDDLKIQGGDITVNAVNNGLRGADSVQIEAGTLAISAGNDGIKSATVDKAGKGFVSVSGGDVTILAGGDGIDAATTLDISGGVLSATAQGSGETSSSKAIKSAAGMTISGGELKLSSTDTAIKCAADLSLSGGSVSIVSANGKGISVDGSVSISGGAAQINAFSDGILAVNTLAMSGGSVSIVAGADGIQAGKNVNGFPSETGSVAISGGDLSISACKRGIDAKIELGISGGTVFALSGSKNAIEVSGGAQLCASFMFSGSAGSEVSFGELDSLKADWDFTSVLFSSSALGSGTEYHVVCGDNAIDITL